MAIYPNDRRTGMYAFYYDAPGTPHVYRLVTERIGTARPEGLVDQVVTRTETGLRHLNVWESREQWERFRDSTVRPAVSAVLSQLGIEPSAEPPTEHLLDLVDVGPGRG